MRRLFNFNKSQIARRNEYDVKIVKFGKDEVASTGLLEGDEFDEKVSEELFSSSVSLSTAWNSGDMPVYKFDDEMQKHLKKRHKIVLNKMKQGLSCMPWHVLPIIPKENKDNDTLYYSQQSLGSCMGHADTFAGHGSILSSIAMGYPLKYRAINALYTWWLSKNKSLRGGQSVGAQLQYANKVGHFLQASLGTNNTKPSNEYTKYSKEAKDFQWGICILPSKSVQDLTKQVFMACAAGYGVAFGNSTAVSGIKIDSNGVKVTKISGNWAHACGGENTCVYTTDGIKTYAELANKQFYTLSYSHRLGRAAIKRARCIYGGKKPCVKVTTNIGIFTMSYDHPFLTKDGFCIPITNLRDWSISLNKRDKLMLLQGSTRMDKQGYALLSLYDGNNNKIRLHRLMGIDILGANKKDIIHHIDEDILNNNIDNLQIISRSEHTLYHSSGKRQTLESRVKRSKTINKRYLISYLDKMIQDGISLPNKEFLSVEEVCSILGLKSVWYMEQKLRDNNFSYDRVINKIRYYSRGQWLEILNKLKTYKRAEGKKIHWFRPQDHYIGRRYIETSEERINGVFIINIKDIGDQDIYSIEVDDPEIDDKRPLTEHNYMICPEGANRNRYTAHGIFVGNTSFSSWQNINGTEYVGWVNSWGNRYGSHEDGSPGDMAWMTFDMVSKMLSTAIRYGNPYMVVPESQKTSTVSIKTIKAKLPSWYDGKLKIETSQYF